MPNNNLSPVVAYLSMEIAFDADFANYAGGLGILAGDFLRSAADSGLPFIGVTLLNQNGYFRQKVGSDGKQKILAENNRRKNLKKIPFAVSVEIAGREIMINIWRYLINDRMPVYLLDTDHPANSPSDRRLTSQLYNSDPRLRLKQEIILGRGGLRALETLGHDVNKFVINEYHGILAAQELLLKLETKLPAKAAEKELRRRLFFVSHTPVRAGADIIPVPTLLKYQPDFPRRFLSLAPKNSVDLTALGIRLAGRVYGVSRKHAQTLRKEFPGAKTGYITNGVHPSFWTGPDMADLYDRHTPDWRQDDSRLKNIGRIPIAEIGKARQRAKTRLFNHIQRMTGEVLDEKTFTIAFARRFTHYKQPLLLLSDMEKLRKINSRWPLQIIYAGKAHPRDKEGQKMIKEIYRLKKKHQQIKIVFLENYDIKLARLLTSGADLWLSNPLPPYEACGTSGMKAALNAVPQLSTPDGWWPEAAKAGQNGWTIEGKGASGLYRRLQEILPLYYESPAAWLGVGREAAKTISIKYSSGRMIREYWKNIISQK